MARHLEALDPRVQARRHHRPRRRADLLRRARPVPGRAGAGLDPRGCSASPPPGRCSATSARSPPAGLHTFLTNVVTQVQGKAGAAGVAGIIGIVIALWSTSGYVAAFMRASNAIYDVDEGRPVWKTGPVRLLITLALVIMLVIAAAIVVLTGPIA